MKMPVKKTIIAPLLREYLRGLGQKGGKARAKNLKKTPAGRRQLVEQAKHAAAARWPKKRKAA